MTDAQLQAANAKAARSNMSPQYWARVRQQMAVECPNTACGC